MEKINREKLRVVFFEAWQKHQKKMPLTPLEIQLVDIILIHPEYYQLLNQEENYLSMDFDETNPFLHLSLHLSVREQTTTNRPSGITSIYQSLVLKSDDPHKAEHQIMDCLAEILWSAQQTGKTPDELYYLECLRNL